MEQKRSALALNKTTPIYDKGKVLCVALISSKQSYCFVNNLITAAN